MDYLRVTLRMLSRDPWLYVRLVAMFGALALVGAWLAVADVIEGFGRTAIVFGLDAVSSAFAPAVVIAAVAAGYRGRRPGVAAALRAGLAWLPRYLGTNLHTSAIFWIPMGSLVAGSQWLVGQAQLEGANAAVAGALWLVLIVLAGLYLHSRTLLAPCLALHADLPATLESWRLSGRHFGRVFATMVISCAPVVVVMGAGIGVALTAAEVNPELKATLVRMLPFLTCVGLQLIRPFLYPATWALCDDLWREEQQERSRAGEPPTPSIAVWLLVISDWYRLIGRRSPATA
jgi:hypothetical protein